jgi:DUF1009 family protein
MEKIALVAGADKFPILLAQAARSKGCKVVAIAINGQTNPELAEHVDKIYWIDIGQLGKVFQILLLERLRKVVLAGKVPKSVIFKNEVEKDDEALSVLQETEDRRSATLLKEVARRLQKIGVTLMDSTTFLQDHLVKEGVLTIQQPDDMTWQDIRFGERVATEIARLDIGQTVAVKNKDVVAVEGVEGTNETILRAGALVGRGIVIVKVARPNQ